MAGESILVVEDEEANLRLFTYLLSAKGYRCAGPPMRRRRWSCWGNFIRGLILMDLQLPGTNGYGTRIPIPDGSTATPR